MDDIDALFALPLAEFTSARNALAARLKQTGRADESKRVKALGKPSVSAWAVNQLYRRHRKEFDRLLAAGRHFGEAQASQIEGKPSDTRGPLEARRQALSELSHLADTLLREAGHSPASDTMRRITNTLEAISGYPSLPDAAVPGRLTTDLDPPGFESLAALISGAAMSDRTDRTLKPPRTSTSQTAAGARTNSQKERQINDTEADAARQATNAAAKVSLQNAERALGEASLRARGAEAALKRANADVIEAEKRKREAEERLEKARAVSEEAGQRARRLAAEALEATKALEEAARIVEKASEELRSLRPGLPR